MNAEGDVWRIICTRIQVGTAYLDFLQQMLYHTPFKNALPLDLLFKFSVAKKDLSRSFGWDEHSMGHEVQQFTRHVCEKLEVMSKVREPMEASNKVHSALVMLFSKIENGLDLFLPTAKSKSSITFFELDVPEKEEHFIVGTFFIKDSQISSQK